MIQPAQGAGANHLQVIAEEGYFNHCEAYYSHRGLMKLKLPNVLALGIAFGLTPSLALAQQQTEPFLPVPQLPVAPNVPVAPAVPLDQGKTVVDRPRPEFDPLGVRFGDFFFFPRGEVDESFNDNIFATNVGEKSDFITTLAPTFDIRSNLPTNAINLSAGAILSWYANNSNFNTQDAFANADGRLDVDNTHDFHGALRAARLHEDPGAPTFPGNASQPVVYNTYEGTAGFSQTKLRVGYSADLTARREEYEAVPTFGGGLLPQSDRNNNAYEAALQGSYEFVANYRGFVRGALNYRDYDHAAIGAPTRTSHGFRIDAGARIDITGVTYAELFAGYLQQDYQASSLGTVSGPDIGANVVWNATQLTSVTLKAERTIADAPASVVGGTASPAYFHSTAGVRVDHELLRNLLLDGQVAYANDDFQGINRTDNDYLVGAGAKYLLTRNLYLGADYAFEHRESSGTQAINPFSRNIIMLRLSTQL